VKWLLLALWVTGVSDADDGDRKLMFHCYLGKPRLLAKLIVVGALTPKWDFAASCCAPDGYGQTPESQQKAATIAATLGAVSATNWLYASFCSGRPKSYPLIFSLYDFVMLYLLALALAVSYAILVVRKPP